MNPTEDLMLLCSNYRCLRPWSPHADRPPALIPVVERRPDGDRRWHPCPDCLDEDRLTAVMAHGLRERAAADLASIADRDQSLSA